MPGIATFECACNPVEWIEPKICDSEAAIQSFRPLCTSSLQLAMEHIKRTFARCKQEKRAAFVAYVTAGFPEAEETVDILLSLEAGGAGLNPNIAL